MLNDKILRKIKTINKDIYLCWVESIFSSDELICVLNEKDANTWLEKQKDTNLYWFCIQSAYDFNIKTNNYKLLRDRLKMKIK